MRLNWSQPPIVDPANVAITGGTANFDDGTANAPSIGFASEADGTGTGFFRKSAGFLAVSVNGTERAAAVSGGWIINGNAQLVSTGSMSWSSGAYDAAADTSMSRQAAGRVAIMGATATPAGGSASLGLVFGSTSGFGIYIGSGVPTLSAAQGSLYLCSNGSSTSTRAYINTNGTTGWTAITTAA